MMPPRAVVARARGLIPTSLTARLVAATVALVALVCVLIGTVTTLAMRTSLTNQLDGDVQKLVPTGGRTPGDTRGRGPGTVQIFLPTGGAPSGFVVGDDPGDTETLPAADLVSLSSVPNDSRIHTIDVPGFGKYRVISVVAFQPSTGQEGVGIWGLPMADMDATLRRLLVWELALTVAGVALAAIVGQLLVRRQLRPLREVADTAHEVAALPLASGAVGGIARVPERLTDEATEAGQVGAALNTLLEHVESSLAARHRSELQVRQFVADASHELRTPLTTIRGYTELARRRPEDTAVAQTALAKVQEESARMASLVEDLLLLARLDQGRPLERAPVDLTRMLVEAVSDARVVDPGHVWQLALPSGADPGAPVVVPGDEGRLHQVIANLLSNARAYTPAGTTVTVTVLPDGFAVHDDGPGFAPTLVPVAFERFTRGDAGRQRESGTGNETGAGLGLSLVKAIVESHGGTVSLQSVPGDTTITVRLPR